MATKQATTDRLKRGIKQAQRRTRTAPGKTEATKSADKRRTAMGKLGLLTTAGLGAAGGFVAAKRLGSTTDRAPLPGPLKRLLGTSEQSAGQVARVTSGQMPPDKFDQAMQVYREQVLPALQQERGFKRATMSGDRATGKTLAISVWESAEAMQAAEASYQQALSALRPFLSGPTTRDQYEVLLQA